MLNNDLDLPHWRERLLRHGRVQIPDVLQAGALERLRRCLTNEGQDAPGLDLGRA